MIESSKAAMFTLCQMRGGSLAILSGFYFSVNTEPDVDWFTDNGSFWLIIVVMLSRLRCVLQDGCRPLLVRTAFYFSVSLGECFIVLVSIYVQGKAPDEPVMDGVEMSG